MKKIISNLTKDNIIDDLNILNEWYLSSAFVITWEKWKYVIRKCKNNVPGYEYVGDIYRSYMISHAMYINAFDINNIQSYGVFEYEWDVYHIQDFIEWNIKKLSDYNEDDIINISNKIALLHNKYYNWANIYWVYKRSLREVVTNYETILSLYEQSIGKNNIYISDIINLLWKQYRTYVDNNVVRPCVMLHGDFWHSNIIFKENIPYFIDFSRIPYWEPWIDIWNFLANFLIEYVLTGEEKYQRYYHIFLQSYKDSTNDHDIEKYTILNILFVMWVSLSPKVQEFLQRSDHEQNKIYNFIVSKIISLAP